jgi:hypothetical protein
MSRPRPNTLIFAGALLCLLIALFFLTHRFGVPPAPALASTPSPAAKNEPWPDLRDEVATPSSVPFSAADTAALSQKLFTRLTRPDTRANEAILIFKNAEGYQRFLARAARTGVILAGRIDALDIARVRVRAYDTFAADLLARAADYGGISANTFISIPPPPAARLTGPQYAVGDQLFATLGVTPGTDTSAWGRGVTIAVLDGGALPDPTLGARLRYLDIGLGYAGTGAAGLHGTAVASLAAGSSADAPGLAPAATVLSIRVMDTDDKGDIFTVVQGIVAAVDAGARLINLSLGGYSTSEALNRALAYAAARDVLVIAAAGNDAAGRLVFPAADPRVISVGATDAAGRQAAFSNAGPQLRLTAPGVGLQAAAPGNRRVPFSGTSAAAPVVTGALAALLSQSPGLTPAQAVALLQTHSDDGGAAGPDPHYGHGTLNLGWTLARADPARTDTAVSSHHYNVETGILEVVVQNRSARPAVNLALAITLNDRPASVVIPALAPGQSLAIPVPLDAATAAAPITLRTRLDNPAGVTDAVPANNTRASLLDLSGR